jgi:Lar family restriction alleviation protein
MSLDEWISRFDNEEADKLTQEEQLEIKSMLIELCWRRDEMNDKDRAEEKSKLLRCPFCGGEGTVIVRKGKNGWRDRYAVLCDYEHGGCGAESGWYHYEAEAIEAWNRRADSNG